MYTRTHAHTYLDVYQVVGTYVYYYAHSIYTAILRSSITYDRLYTYIGRYILLQNDIFRLCVRVRACVYTVFNNNRLHAGTIIIYSPAAGIYNRDRRGGVRPHAAAGCGCQQRVGGGVSAGPGGTPIAIFNRRETSQNTNLLCGAHKSCKEVAVASYTTAVREPPLHP